MAECWTFNLQDSGSNPGIFKMIFEIINHVIILNNFVFILGLVGVFLNKKNILIILIAIEIIFLGLNLNFIIVSIYLDDVVGHIFVIFILTIAVAESAIVLSLLIIIYKFKKSINIEIVKENLLNKV